MYCKFFVHHIIEIIKLDKPLQADEFLLANLDASGFYRINYEPQNWDLIAKQLMQNRLVIILFMVYLPYYFKSDQIIEYTSKN